MSNLLCANSCAIGIILAQRFFFARQQQFQHERSIDSDTRLPLAVVKLLPPAVSFLADAIAEYGIQCCRQQRWNSFSFYFFFCCWRCIINRPVCLCLCLCRIIKACC